MEPQRLSSGQGWHWIKQGYALFMKAPLLWMVILAICVVSVAALSAVPMIGEPLASLLLPVILAGLMAGCSAVSKGEELELAYLLSGFQKHTSQLVTLGGIALVAQFLILGLMMIVGGATLVGMITSGQPTQDPEIVRQAVTGAGLAMILGLTLFTLLIMSMQFAPMLVYFRDVPPVSAMKLSLRAFLHNVGPMTVYGLTFLFMAILASLPFMLGWLVLLPIMFTSIYAAYIDIFPEEKIAAATPPESEFF